MISLEWVSDYIDISGLDYHELAKKITEAGINIEKVITNKIDNLVIGEVTKCESIPNTHLHVCLVDIKTEKLQIVCGAPNVREQMKVIVAKDGAILPGGIEIKKSIIHNTESNGMLCALFELGLEEKNESTIAKGIYEVPNTVQVGAPAMESLNLLSTVYELDIHKHRNNDCYYHIGFAYEIASILNKKVTLPSVTYKEVDDDVNNHIKLNVKTTKCPYYLGKMATNIKVKESPDFIKKRLHAVGMRSINNVVDISNYVMLEFGQPLHFFDKDLLGDNIIVRDATEHEELTTLDNTKRVLNNSDIVIANNAGPVCIAGVMGGLNTEVTTNTKNIFIESAIFDSVSIRNTAQKLNLKSEASIRYGKGLSYEYTCLAIQRACHLLEKYADATIISGTIVHDKIDKTPKIVKFKADEINNLLGINISTKDMEYELNRLDFPYTLDKDEFTVTIPKRRLDIDPYVNDLAEEIGRLYGYQNLTETMPIVSIRQGKYQKDILYKRLISKRLRSLGLNETKTYTLTSPVMASLFNYDNKKQKTLPNPMSTDKSVIRTSILPSLLNIYEYNKARKVENIFLYEISKTYDENYKEEYKVAGLLKGTFLNNPWQGSKNVDFYYVKGIVENLLNYLGFNNHYQIVASTAPNFHPGITASILLDNEVVGVIGRIHPSTNKDEIYLFELSMNKLMQDIEKITYTEPPKYPSITKDMAFIVSKNITSDEVKSVIISSGGENLKDCTLFDIYVGDNVSVNEKSLAFKLTFVNPSKTLTDEEVMNSFNNIITTVESKLNAKLRDK